MVDQIGMVEVLVLILSKGGGRPNLGDSRKVTGGIEKILAGSFSY